MATVTTPSGAKVDSVTGALVSGPPSVGNTITTAELSGGGSTIQLPKFEQTNPNELQGVIKSIPEITSGQALPAEGIQNDLRSEIMRSLTTLAGRDQATLQAENAAGIPEQTKNLNELANRLRTLQAESLAIPLQIQEEFTGKGATMGGAEPIQTSRLRQNAIQALSVSAQAQAVQGNIALAQQQVDRAIQLEFAPEERRLAFLQQAYAFNREDLERQSKEKADRMKIELDERSRLLEEQKAERTGVENLTMRVASFNAPQQVIDRMRSARSVNEALSIAAPYMQDPKAKAELGVLALESQLKKIQIQKQSEELDIFRKYGGLTPTQWKEAQDAEEKLRKEQGLTVDKAKEASRKLNEQEAQVNAILNSSGLSTVVGPNILSRGLARQKGAFSTIGAALVSPFTFGQTPGVLSEFTGSADTIVALTEQMLSQQFLDKLVQVKGEGATFGALTDREGNSLRAAANAIAQTKIERDGKVIGYDIPEAEFKKQFNVMLNAIQYAREKNGESLFSSDEQAVLSEIDSIQQSFNPGNFFNQ